ncbi:MAG: transcription antitermination factor NusB [Deltaproteobacteria bacterium]|nr:transcription antitermination factor NusB [Deltaproteobacteria bacterium]
MEKRRKAREQIVQILYQMDAAGVQALEALKLYESNFCSPRILSDFVREQVLGIADHLAELDRMVTEHAENWRLGRMSAVDRNILRMAVYELLFRDDIPPIVSINEAIDLSKKFGTDESGGFVNGILDSIYKAMQEQTPDKENNDEQVHRE